VPVRVKRDVVPLHTGDTAVAVALIFDVTEITIFKGVIQPFNAI
jgi:hypothetical protein